MEFVETICSLLLFIALAFGLLYCLRHRAGISRWVNNYESKDNVAEKDSRIRTLKRRIEDSQAEIERLNAEAETGE